jgi:hypothetical protein
MTPMRAIMVGALRSTTSSIASTAVCHSARSCSALGSFRAYLAASSRVTSWRPRGSGIRIIERTFPTATANGASPSCRIGSGSNRGASSFSGRGQGAPAAPQVQACSPCHGRSGWLSHTQPQSSQSEYFISASNPISRMGGGDMRDVHHGVLDAMGVNHLAARAPHQRAGFLRRHPFAGFPHRIFPRGPVLLIAPRLKIGFGSF